MSSPSKPLWTSFREAKSVYYTWHFLYQVMLLICYMDKWWMFAACPHLGLGWEQPTASPFYQHLLKDQRWCLQWFYSSPSSISIPGAATILCMSDLGMGWCWCMEPTEPWDSCPRSILQRQWQVINKTYFVCLPTLSIISPVQGGRAVFKFLKTCLSWLYPYRSWPFDKISLSLVPFHKSWQKAKPFMMSVQLISR